MNISPAPGNASAREGHPLHGGGASCYSDKHTHDYVRPVNTLRWHWANSCNNGQRAGPARIVAFVEGLKTIVEAELHRSHRQFAQPNYYMQTVKGLRVKG